MSKYNKELAINVEIELIRANQRKKKKKNASVDGVTNTPDLESVNNIIKSISKTLDELDNSNKN